MQRCVTNPDTPLMSTQKVQLLGDCKCVPNTQEDELIPNLWMECIYVQFYLLAEVHFHVRRLDRPSESYSEMVYPLDTFLIIETNRSIHFQACTEMLDSMYGNLRCAHLRMRWQHLRPARCRLPGHSFASRHRRCRLPCADCRRSWTPQVLNWSAPAL